uniref:Rhamnogalacturonate lyase n=1 Tax=Quercus lobata TaxID=97700 RepID=A0A7N2MKI3_QUELO
MSQGVQLHIEKSHVVMDNGILKVKLSKPGGIVTGIKYNGIDNLLEVLNEEVNRGYWDLVWSEAGSTGTTGTSDVIKGTSFRVIMESEMQVEISFTRLWDPSLQGKSVPLNIDKRFIMLSNSPGFYTYAIYEHLKEWPPFNLPQTRIVFKLRKDKFHYMAMADNRQRYMPLPDDRLPGRGKPLATPEAVLLVNPVEPEFKGEVDDKYQYSCENKDLRVHGWICMDPPVGFWQITPSSEFRSGGPIKQNLTSHVGPVNLAMFLSAHYAGEDLVLKLNPDEPWKKVFGPIFMYLNSVTDGGDPLQLWEDAKNQMMIEVESWPYDFPASDDFPTADQRGSVSGRLQIQDRLPQSFPYPLAYTLNRDKSKMGVGMKRPYPSQKCYILAKLRMARSGQGWERLKILLILLSVKIRSRGSSLQNFGTAELGSPIISTSRSLMSIANMAPAC